MRILQQDVTLPVPTAPDLDAVKSFVRVTRPSEDEQIRDSHLAAAVETIERYTGRLIASADAAGARTVTTLFEIDAPPERWLAGMPGYPDTPEVTRSTLERWNPDADPPAYQTVPADCYTPGPAGRWRPHEAGIYRIEATATPGDPPANVVEAVLRLTAYYYEHRALATSAEAGPMTLAGAIIKSGAGGLLRNFRRVTR